MVLTALLTALLKAPANPGHVLTLILHATGCLQNRWRSRLPHDLHQHFRIYLPLPQTSMPIGARAGSIAGIIEVHQVDTAGDRADAVHDPVEFLPGGMRVAGVQTETHLIEIGGGADGLPQTGNRIEMARHRMGSPGSVLDQDRAVQPQAVDSLEPVLETDLWVVLGRDVTTMDDHSAGAEISGHADVLLQQLAARDADPVVRRRQVDNEGRVYIDAHAGFLSGSPQRLRPALVTELGGFPAPRVSDLELHDRCWADACIVDRIGLINTDTEFEGHGGSLTGSALRAAAHNLGGPIAGACQTCGMGAWTWLGEYLSASTGAVRCALGLNAPCVMEETARLGWVVPVSVAVVAGTSLMLGQWAILAINKVGRWRTLLTLAISSLGMLLTGVIEALLVALCGWMLLGRSLRVAVLLPSVLIAFAPYWLGFLVLLPYSGPGIARALKVWHLLILWALLRPVLDASATGALAVAATAWIATQVLGLLADRPPIRLRERVFRLVSNSAGWTGRDLMESAAMGQTR